MKRLLLFVFLSVVLSTQASAEKPKSLFYLTGDPTSVRSFLAHADKVDILVPAWYSATSEGLVSGGPNPLVMETARQHHVPVMPIITNAGFVQAEFHKFLGDPAAIKRMLDAVIQACKDNGYIGIQFDFENVRWTDRDALSALVKVSAEALHKEKLQLSIATVPNAPGAPGSDTAFSAWLYENWRGAYDLKAIGAAVDLVCLMTYDQNTRWTMPGPVAGWNWTVSNLDYALKSVPHEKLSLGIPLYGYHWFAGMPAKDPVTGLNDKPNPTANYISAPDALDLARTYNAKLEWDAADRTTWCYLNHGDMREWLFITDARTFKERYQLVQDRNLQGFCSWVLGNEDPAIWDLLPQVVVAAAFVGGRSFAPQ
jgi:spore germination protein YaaH